jgi:hypothetical protein
VTAATVDIDDLTSWPAEVAELVDDYADRHRGRTSHTSDLEIRPDDERLMDAALAGHRLVVYHCTRLLPHEEGMVRSQGLRLLTADLVRERIDAAQAHGYLTNEEVDAFHGSHVFATGEEAYRANGADVIVGNWALEEEWGVNPLLSIWGREAMYMSSRSIEEARLEQLGRPAIIVAHLDYDPPDRIAWWSRTLLRGFVGKRLGLEQPGTQMKLVEPLHPEEIADIWHPGMNAYDCFPLLWRR